jgi:nicotinate (nicotinamide) nucleotide adenylyltransferase
MRWRPFGGDLHPRFKRWCDEYFYLKHRKEARGVGGIFFDDFNELGFDQSYEMVQSVGNGFLDAYLPILKAPQGPALRRTRTRLPGLPARTLRRVQPGVGPRHPVRPAVGRTHRGDPDVDAADRQMALRLASGSRAAPRKSCTATSSPPGLAGFVSRCIALLGGSFDPVHHGHVALAELFARLLRPDELRLLPAGQPWQKANGLQASAAERVAMLELAFASSPAPVTIDTREIARHMPTYTVETLRELRAELGPDASIVFLMGADQLQKLDTWRDWTDLFGLANFGVAARPGYRLDDAALPPGSGARTGAAACDAR